jgi:hypothetical protein
MARCVVARTVRTMSSTAGTAELLLGDSLACIWKTFAHDHQMYGDQIDCFRMNA